MSPTEQRNRLEGIAVVMAAAFRDKYDFSSVAQHDDLAELAFTSAKAIVKKSDAVLVELEAALAADIKAHPEKYSVAREPAEVAT